MQKFSIRTPGRLLPGLLFYVAILVLNRSAIAQSTAETGEQRLRAYGSVTDVNGQPIAGANVKVIAPIRPYLVDPVNRSYGSVSCTTNQRGEFDVNWPASDTRFCQEMLGQAMVLVTSEGHAPSADSFFMWRFAVDAPLQIGLESSEAIKIAIRDASGKSVPNANVRPAKFDGLTLPYEEAEPLQQVSNIAGTVVFSSRKQSNLQAVYVSHPDFGHQYLPAARAESGLQVKLLKTRAFTGKVTATKSELYDPPKLNDITIHFLSATDAKQTSFSWCDVALNEDGEFAVPHLSEGTTSFRSTLPAEMPFTFDSRGRYRSLEVTESYYELELVPATRVEGRIVEIENGVGIPNLLVAHDDRDGRKTITNADGDFHFWAGPERISYLPFDSIGRYRTDANRYYFPKNLPEHGRLATGELGMQKMSGALGKVVNAAGATVVGAEVLCRVQSDNSVETFSTWSDREGSFQFYGMVDGVTVSLTAKLGTQATSRGTTLVLSPEARPELVLEEQPSVYFVGQVVDSLGAPIPNASVVIRKGRVMREEEYTGLDRMPEPLFNKRSVVADSAGRFKSPVTTEFRLETSIAVTAPGYQPLNTSWKLRSDHVENMNAIDVGKLRLLATPALINIHVNVRDSESKEEVKNARIVFIGGQSGSVKKQLEGSAQTELSVMNSPQVIAATADGYCPSIQTVNSFTVNADGNYTVEFVLSKGLNAKRTPADIKGTQIKTIAGSLVDLVPEPTKTDTFFKMRSHLVALQLANPAAFVDRLNEMKTAGDDMSVLNSIGTYMPDRELRRLLPLVESDDSKIYLLDSLIQRVPSEERKFQLITELATVVRRTGGNAQMFGYSLLVCSLLKYDAQELAIQFVEEAFNGNAQLQQIISEGKRLDRKGMAGVAASFAPPLAIVDCDLAMKLIEFTAHANEIDSLKSQAIAFAANVGDLDWQTHLESLPDKKLVAAGLCECGRKVGFKSVEIGKALLTHVPSGFGKAELLLQLAKQCEMTNAERIDLAIEALSILQNTPNVAMGGNASELAATASVQLAKFDPILAEKFAFESLWLCEMGNWIVPFYPQCELAKQLSRYDTAIARKLIEPCFDNWSWLFDEIDYEQIYRYNLPLVAAISIDPQWAIAETRKFFESELVAQPSRKLSTILGLTHRLAEMLVQIESE